MDDPLKLLLKEKSSTVHSISPESTVAECVFKMNEHRIGALLVIDRGRLIGIFTERDVLTKVVGKSRDPAATRTGDVMTVDLLTVAPETTVKQAMMLITQRRVRHLPVMRGEGELVGLISIGDLTRWLVRNQEIMIKDLENYIHGTPYRGNS
jgi:CBS domain-containing protein